MELIKAEQLAVRLMTKHNLFNQNWKFAFDNARQRLGFCSYKKKTISLSKNFISLLGEDEITDTILHEIAHALVGRKCGHGYTWQRKAIEIGCNGLRLYNGEARVEAKYKGTCNPDFFLLSLSASSFAFNSLALSGVIGGLVISPILF